MAESGICETEQHEVLATQAKMMKGHERELEQARGGNGPGNSKNREWWFFKESRQKWEGERCGGNIVLSIEKETGLAVSKPSS